MDQNEEEEEEEEEEEKVFCLEFVIVSCNVCTFFLSVCYSFLRI